MSRAGPVAVLLLALPGAGASTLRAQAPRIQRTGDVIQIAIPAIAAATTFLRHDAGGTRELGMAFLTNFAATEALKFGVARERPDGSDHRSFPSGHTSTAFRPRPSSRSATAGRAAFPHTPAQRSWRSAASAPAATT